MHEAKIAARTIITQRALRITLKALFMVRLTPLEAARAGVKSEQKR